MKLAAFAVVLAACSDPSPAQDSAPDAAPALPDADTTFAITSGDGITVLSVTPVTERTFDIMVETALVADAATSHGNGIRVTLPADYLTSGKRYPVIYNLHGAGGGSYRDQFSGGLIENIAGDVIVVMPDGGKNGWYTDWLDHALEQNWKSYHLTQLVPFIDHNLRTLGTRTGRGIVGLSMGGFGASRYATDRPDLFGALATFSGAIDLEQPGIQAAVFAPALLFGLPPFGAFGEPSVFNPAWAGANPVRRAERLATVKTFIYIGAGTDIAEVIVRLATESMHRALEAKGIAHTYIDYGVPGAYAYGTCNGGHTFACYGYAVTDAMPRVVAALDPAQ